MGDKIFYLFIGDKILRWKLIKFYLFIYYFVEEIEVAIN